MPALLERLRGTPVRAAALLFGAGELLHARAGEGWTPGEHVDHLGDVHAFDMIRLEEFLARAPVLTTADGAAVHANGGEPAVEVLERLLAAREVLVRRLEAVTAEAAGSSCLHPALLQSVRLVDWVHSVAEHDDHHLAMARQVIRACSGRTVRAGPGGDPAGARSRS